MLTARQSQVLRFVSDTLATTSITPSYEEMKEALGIASKSCVSRLVNGLEERGYLRRIPGKARALEIVKLPQDFHAPPDHLETLVIPVMGEIAAGSPIEAIQVQIKTLTIPASMIGDGPHYALRVSGTSMIEAGISDGDTALIRQQDDCESGDIAVALVDGDVATLKRIRKLGRRITLEPANRDLSPVTYSSSRVAIQGKLVGILRAY